METAPIARVQRDLQTVRRLFFSGRYPEALPIIKRLLERLESALSAGTNPDLQDPLLSYYYTTKVMLKVARFHDQMFREGKAKNSVQILVLDSKRQRVLLQKRGPFKRLFADKLTVSANAKPKAGQSLEEAGANAVNEEVGIAVDTSRFQRIGAAQSYHSRLISYDFHAFTPREERRVREVYAKLERDPRSVDGVLLDYNPYKRCLCIFSIDPHVPKAQVKRVADEVKAEMGIPYVHPVFDDDRNSLLIYQLNEEEEKQVQRKIEERHRKNREALAQIEDGADAETLKTIDSDQMEFVSWLDVRNDFAANPRGYALDLTGPYFGNDAVWSKIMPEVIGVNDPLAAHVSVAGGKGANTHILRTLSRRLRGLNVPETSILTTFAYDRLVLGNPAIRENIERLEKAAADREIKRISERIRRQIMCIRLPEGLKEMLDREFERLGGDIAVRSSATTEDLKGYSAAGQADSFLHLITPEQVYKSVKKVWASLFADGFVTNRIQNGFSHKEARMAVMLQKFIKPRAAGVVFSIHPQTQRPVYTIGAQPGVGEGVVQGQGQTDSWSVGSMGDVILEKDIKRKELRVTLKKGGGTREERIEMSEPSLSDGKVLELSQIVRDIHGHYVKEDLAENVDVEFVVDESGVIYVVQTRPKSSLEVTTEGGKVVFKVKAVDESRVPEGTPVVQLHPRSPVANPGAVTAELQIVDTEGPSLARPGVILLTHHTNNSWNDVFAKLAGIITTDGDITSHAGQNSQQIKIPCVVGALGALDDLRRFNGQLVTFDADRRKVYLGEMPIIEEVRELGVWVSDPEKLRKVIEESEIHEIFRPWPVSMEKRKEVFVRDFEGQWRRRSSNYGWFQLDYYYKAWDRLTKFLNEKFKDRRPWVTSLSRSQDGLLLWDVTKGSGLVERHPPPPILFPLPIEHLQP